MADIGAFEELQRRVDFHGFVDNSMEERGEKTTEPAEEEDKEEEGAGSIVAKLTRTGSTAGGTEGSASKPEPSSRFN